MRLFCEIKVILGNFVAMDLAANRFALLDKFSNELESGQRPELCILLGDHVHGGGGRLKLELQYHLWFDESRVSRVAVSRCLLPCIPLELLARWDLNFLLASFLMHYEPFSEDVTLSLVENLKSGLLQPYNCRLRALQRWQLVSLCGDLDGDFKHGLETGVFRREIVCSTGYRKLCLLEAVENLQILQHRLKQDIEGVKRSLRRFQFPSELDNQSALETLIIGLLTNDN
jgi:hypothetical protein